MPKKKESSDEDDDMGVDLFGNDDDYKMILEE